MNQSASATSPAALSETDDKAWGPTMIAKEKVLEDALRAAEAERDFLREVVRALTERRGPVRVG